MNQTTRDILESFEKAPTGYSSWTKGVGYDEAEAALNRQAYDRAMRIVGTKIIGKAGTAACSGPQELAKKAWEVGRLNGIKVENDRIRQALAKEYGIDTSNMGEVRGELA